MKLASVRSLKEELKVQASVPALVGSVFASRSAAVLTAARIAAPREVRYSVGVSSGRRRGDYVLGVRIQGGGATARNLAEDIQARAHGEVDVRFVPRVVARADRYFSKRRRPLEAGLSVGHLDITAGTLGFVVEDDEAYYILSNNHVLANVNAASVGDEIVQPGPLDAEPAARNLVAVLDRFVPISLTRSNLLDCAIAQILSDQEFYVGWTEALPGKVKGTALVSEDDLGRPVAKAGRTTGVTRGRITQIEIDDLRVDMGEAGSPKLAVFRDQFEVTGDDDIPFSDGGDSGSLIVGADRIARGLLFAGGADTEGVELTYANQIEAVLTKLGVSLSL